MKAAILSMLKASKTYVSGQEMCNTLGVSRTAVWKVMNQLKEEGYIIEASSNKGYVLTHSPNTITDYEIKSNLGQTGLVEDILYFDSLDSTNSKAKRMANEGENRNILFVTEEQTAGRGRRGRAWSSPKGSGIWMSFLLHPNIAPEHASMLTLVSALAIVKAIHNTTGLEAKIKWPNDIVVNGKKLCGILTEMSCELDYIHYVVIGIGMNVNTTEFPEELSQIGTSLLRESGQEVKRSELLADVIQQMEGYYNQFLETEDLSKLQEEYNACLIHKDQEVRILGGEGIQEGIARGIAADGSLLVEGNDGSINNIISGEVSVRGIYGYV